MSPLVFLIHYWVFPLCTVSGQRPVAALWSQGFTRIQGSVGPARSGQGGSLWQEQRGFTIRPFSHSITHRSLCCSQASINSGGLWDKAGQEDRVICSSSLAALISRPNRVTAPLVTAQPVPWAQGQHVPLLSLRSPTWLAPVLVLAQPLIFTTAAG